MSMMYIEVDGNMVSEENVLQSQKKKVKGEVKIDISKPKLKSNTQTTKKKA